MTHIENLIRDEANTPFRFSGAVDSAVDIFVNMGKMVALLLEGRVVATHYGTKETLNTTVLLSMHLTHTL